MERTLQTARRARSRLAARDVVRRAGRWLVVGAGVGAACVVGGKVFGLPGAWWVWLGAPVLVAATAAAVTELSKKRPLLESASLVDEKLGLQDRLGSALALGAAESKDDPFVKLALAESEAVAPGVDTAKAVPIKFGSSWWTWPTIVAASVAGALWLPESSILKAREQRQIAAATAKQEQSKAAEEIHQALDVARKAAAPDTTKTAAADALAARRLAALEKLEEELRTGKINAGEAREQSARTLEQSAAELEKRSEEAQRASDATRDRIASLAPPSGEAAGNSESESALTRAVRQGDLRAAREAARDLMQKVDQLSPEERAKAARDMEELAQDLARKKDAEPKPGEAPKDATTDTPPNGDSANAPASGVDNALKEELKSQGLSEKQAENVAGAPNEETAKKKLEDLGLPPEAVEKLAKKIDADTQRRSAEETAKQRTDDLSKSLKEAADHLREPPAPSKPGETQDQPKTERPTPEQPTSGEQSPKSGEQKQDSAKPGGEKGVEKTGEKGAEHAPPRQGEQPTKPDEKSGKAGEKSPSGEKGQSGQPGQKEDSTKSRGVNKSGAPDPSKPESTQPGTPGEKGGEKKDGAEGDASQRPGGDKPADPNAQKGTPGTKPDAAKKPDAGKPGGSEQTKGQPAPKSGDKADQQKTGDASDQQKKGAEGQKKPGADDKGAAGEKQDGGMSQGAGDKGGDKRGVEKKDQPGTKADPKTTPKEDGERQSGATGEEKPAAGQKEPAGERGGSPSQKNQPTRGQKGTERPDPSKGQDASQPKPGADQQSAEKQPGATGEKPTEEKAAGQKDASEKPGGEKAGEQGNKKDEQRTGEKQGDGQDAGKKSPAAMKEPSNKDAQPGAEKEQQPGRTPNLDDLPSPDSLQGKALKKVIENLRNMDQDRTDAARDRQASKEMRDRAQKMIENATPEQRKKLEQWAKEFAKETPRGDQPGAGARPPMPSEKDGEGQNLADDGNHQGGAGLGDEPGSVATKNKKLDKPRESGGFKTDVVDARPKDDKPADGRVAGELPGDGKPGAPMLSKQETQEAIQRAKEGAQRAIDDRTIPGRYDRLLRRYFQRLPAKVKSEEKPG